MAKIEALTDIGSGYAAPTVIDDNFDKVETALENTLSRDGSGPNAMGANLDMNGYRILNLPEATNNAEPVRLGDIQGVVDEAVLNVAVGDLIEDLTDTINEGIEDVEAAAVAAGLVEVAAIEAAGVAQVALVEAEGVTQVSAVVGAANAEYYADTTAGLAATEDGDYFLVVGDDTETTYTIYLNNVGVAEEVASAPSVTYLDAALAAVAGQLDLTSTRYNVAGKLVLRGMADPDFLTPGYVTADGAHYVPTLAMRVGTANGLTFAHDPASDYLEVSFGSTEGVVPVGTGGAAIDTRDNRYFAGLKVVRAIGDDDNAGALIVTEDGALHAPRLARPSPVASSGDLLFYQAPDDDGRPQVWRADLASGAMPVQATTAGSNINPVVTDDGEHLIYHSDRQGEGRADLWFQPVDGGAEYPVFSAAYWTVWGDSLGIYGPTSAADRYPSLLAASLGVPVANRSVRGQTSIQIAARQGGAPCLVTVSGDEIPASGSVSVTVSTDMLLDSGIHVAGSFSGTLGGVRGALTGDASGNWTFVRGAAGSEVEVDPATPFLIDTGGTDLGVNVIWVGRNNATDPTQIKADIAAMVAFIKPLSKRIVILGVTNGGSEVSGSTAHTTITGLNDELADLYPDYFLDIRALLVAAYDPEDAQDVIDHGNDVPPTSLRIDSVHFNDPAHVLIADWIEAFAISKQWIS